MFVGPWTVLHVKCPIANSAINRTDAVASTSVRTPYYGHMIWAMGGGVYPPRMSASCDCKFISQPLVAILT